MKEKMDQLNIILFLCNWGPHAAFQMLQDTCAVIFPEIKMVRIPCTGRISKSLLIKAFEMGADGVALVGCSPGSCRYGTGTVTASENTKDIRDILGLLGVGKERMRFETFLPDESDPLLNFIENFIKEIKTLGSSPIGCPSLPAAEVDLSGAIREVVDLHNIIECQDCGKCTSACPLSLIGKNFSPRTLARSILSGDICSDTVKNNIWACLTCGLCCDRCPTAVDFPQFIRGIRSLLNKNKDSNKEAHGGFFQSLMRTMTSPDLKIEHWDWLPEDIQTDPNGKILFFGGCAPYFDIFFRKFLDVNTSNILIDSLRLLNFFDIRPAVLFEERCCGHDLLWSGDKDNFIELAKLNVKAVNDMGIEEIITSCPECYTTLLNDYSKLGLETKFKVTHIYEFLEKEIEKGSVNFRKMDGKLTFQDSCRLCRFEDKSELPRKLINHINPENFTEMQFKGKASICCGNCAWTGCDSFSKALQVQRLKQVHETKSDILITSCPKCQIHFKCAMEDPFLGKALEIDMMDLTSVIAKTIYW